MFGTSVFGACERIDMPAPGDLRPARIEVELHDPAWEAIYAPIAGAVSFAALRLHPLEFLTIRRYLAMVFSALGLLLLVLALWP